MTSKITISKMPKSLCDALKTRGEQRNQRLGNYCYQALEYAYEHQAEYRVPLQVFNDKDFVSVAIPVPNEAFKDQLKEWNPFNNNSLAAIALGILKKHVELNDW